MGTIEGTHRGSWGDFQWHSFGHTTSHFFFEDVGVQREAWNSKSAYEGMSLCRFGHTTGKQCDEVYKINVSQGVDDRLVAMKNDKAAPGDSGGPWFYGNDIYGVHKGNKSIWFNKRDTWSQLVNVDEALGVSVDLCPRDSCHPWDCGLEYVGCGTWRQCPCQECPGSVCPDGSCCPGNGICLGGGFCPL